MTPRALTVLLAACFREPAPSPAPATQAGGCLVGTKVDGPAHVWTKISERDLGPVDPNGWGATAATFAFDAKGAVVGLAGLGREVGTGIIDAERVGDDLVVVWTCQQKVQIMGPPTNDKCGAPGIRVERLGLDGTTRWSTLLATTAITTGNSISVRADGTRVAVSGYSFGPIDLEGTIDAHAETLVAVLDARTGHRVWARTYANVGTGYATSAKFDGAGDLVFIANHGEGRAPWPKPREGQTVTVANLAGATGDVRSVHAFGAGSIRDMTTAFAVRDEHWAAAAQVETVAGCSLARPTTHYGDTDVVAVGRTSSSAPDWMRMLDISPSALAIDRNGTVLAVGNNYDGGWNGDITKTTSELIELGPTGAVLAVVPICAPGVFPLRVAIGGTRAWVACVDLRRQPGGRATLVELTR